MGQFDKWQQKRPRRSRRRGTHGFGLLLLICIAVLAVVQVGLTPWVLHIGGRFTPAMTWDGYGEVRASNGGRYLLFTHLEGGALYARTPSRRGSTCFGSGCDNVIGTAILCSRQGLDSLALGGKVNGFLHTDGSSTWIHLTRGSPLPIPPGWVVAFHGNWNGPELSLDSPDNSFTELFTPAGEIRRATSTADAGTAHVTLRYSTPEEFEVACGALRAAASHNASR